MPRTNISIEVNKSTSRTKNERIDSTPFTYIHCTALHSHGSREHRCPAGGDGHRLSPVDEDGGGGVVRERADEHEQVEDLVAVADAVEPAGAPALRHAGDVEPGAGGVHEAHEELERQREVALAVCPVEPQRVQRRQHPGEGHGHEEAGAEVAQARRRARGRQEQRHHQQAQQGDGGQVDELRAGAAEEGVVDGREEGGDDHHRDPRVVELPEEAREAARVARQQVRRRAHRQARHGARQEHRPRPPRHRVGVAVAAPEHGHQTLAGRQARVTAGLPRRP
uniref:Uncharacterized protein n=1 Tax=Zea mays TaxID=4577 RepID=B7ZZG3_MAIZE|nr:unknown [Zea mays]